jgi:hypothetical protein
MVHDLIRRKHKALLQGRRGKIFCSNVKREYNQRFGPLPAYGLWASSFTTSRGKIIITYSRQFDGYPALRQFNGEDWSIEFLLSCMPAQVEYMAERGDGNISIFLNDKNTGTSYICYNPLRMEIVA